MTSPIRIPWLLNVLMIAAQASIAPNAASAQAPPYTAVTTDSLRTLAENLKRDLQNGSIQTADLHAIELQLALIGGLKEDMSANVSVLEQQPSPDNPQPQLTSGLVPEAEKLIQALDRPDLDVARKYSEQLATQIHAQHEVYLRSEVESNPGITDQDKYFKLSRQLQNSLWKGEVAAAAVLAVEVQSAEDLTVGKGKRPAMSTSSRNLYNINDALGRAAFLRKDYVAAGDYLLKAADTPGRDPALRSFGPDLWLARALLAQGYEEVLVSFLERCKTFWPNPKLDKWISVIQGDGTPDFKSNIYSKDPILSN